MAYLYNGFLLLALLLIYFAFKQYGISRDLLNSGIKTKANVIELIAVSSDDGYTYKPVFEYTDKAKNVVTFKSDVSSSPAAYDVGDKVFVVYSENGDERKVVSFWGLYRWTVILLSIASPLLIIGGGYFLYSRG